MYDWKDDWKASIMKEYIICTDDIRFLDKVTTQLKCSGNFYNRFERKFLMATVQDWLKLMYSSHINAKIAFVLFVTHVFQMHWTKQGEVDKVKMLQTFYMQIG